MNQNALRQIFLETGKETLHGFSVSGLASYLQVPELDIAFDMGECPLSAVKLNHVALTHAHGDHHRCLMRHRSLRRMTGIEKEAVYLVPAPLVDPALRLFREEARFEGVRPAQYTPPELLGIESGGEPIELPYRRDLRIGSFELRHRILSVGYTLFDFKKKLRDEFIGLPGPQLAQMKLRDGVEITRDVLEPRISYLGDTTAAGVRAHPEIWKSRIVVLESTFIEEDDLEMARKKGHTHLSEIGEILRELGSDLKSERIILNHFSMKCTKSRIAERLDEVFPDEELRSKITPLV